MQIIQKIISAVRGYEFNAKSTIRIVDINIYFQSK